MNNIINQLTKIKLGNDLIGELKTLPPYNKDIRNADKATRLVALSDIYNIYIPSAMSVEIYSKLYLALLHSLQKKSGLNARRQQNENYKIICQRSYNSILGGSDSFTITGHSGLGKSLAINKAIEIITQNGIIETKNPYTRIIPCLVVQCPFDCSVKGLLLEILRKADETLNSDYYDKALRNRVTTDMLIGCVSQIALNHIGLLIVDEIQNVANGKNGKALVGMLTQLINNSGISICMVGTPDSTPFFEQAIQLARRSLGLSYGAMEYNQFFFDFCRTLFEYQYTSEQTEISDGIIQWLYEHSGGIISVVVSLIHDSQEIAILNGSERMNLDTLNEAYKKRLTMLHGYIEPNITHKSQTSVQKQQVKGYTRHAETSIYAENTVASIIAEAKDKQADAVGLLQKVFTVEVIDL